MSDTGINWVKTARDIAISAVGLFLQGALFALGGIAVARVASQNSAESGGNLVPFRKTGT